MRWVLLPAAAGALLGAVLGCAIGPEQEPGCHDDAECGQGYSCRAGACLRTTTERSPPPDAGDGGEAADGDGG